jgi:hypothetical protein
MLSDSDVSRCIMVEHDVVEANTQGTREEVLDMLEYLWIRMVEHDFVVGVLWCRQRGIDNVGGDRAWLYMRPAIDSQSWLVPCDVVREGAKIRLLFETYRFRARPTLDTRC